jgi:tripartite ATP-independent transporter DctM subunit
MSEGEEMNRRSLVAWLGKGESVLAKASAFSRLTNSIGTALLFMLVVFIFADVFLRYIFSRPIIGSIDISELTLVSLVFLGVAYTQHQRAHVSMDILRARASEKNGLVIDIIANFLSLGVVALLCWRALATALLFIKTGNTTQVLTIPTAPFVLLVAFGLILLGLEFLRELCGNLVKGLALNLGRRLWLLALGTPALVLVLGALWTQEMLGEPSLVLVAIIGMVFFSIILMLGMPVALVLAMVGFVFYSHIRGVEAGFNMIGVLIYRTTASYTWSVIGFFLLMGVIVTFTGLSRDLYYSGNKWFGHLPGGMALATIGAGTGFAAIVGDSLSAAVGMGTVALPELKRYKYDDALATGVVISGGITGPMIPPSIGFILYALLAEQSIGDLFLAGVIPGLILAGAFILTTYIRCRKNPNLGPKGERSNWGERTKSLKSAGPIGALFMLVVGGIYSGVFTPTEGGSIGCAGAFIIGASMRRFNRQVFIKTLLEGGKMIAMCFLILSGAMMFGQFITITRVPAMLAELIAGLAVPPTVVLICILLVYLGLGAVMPSVPMILITVPIFYPVAIALGFDMIWFGVLVVLMMNLANVTPPWGISLFGVKGVNMDVSMVTIFRGVMPYILTTILVLVLILVFPSLATWLPNVLK